MRVKQYNCVRKIWEYKIICSRKLCDFVYALFYETNLTFHPKSVRQDKVEDWVTESNSVRYCAFVHESAKKAHIPCYQINYITIVKKTLISSPFPEQSEREIWIQRPSAASRCAFKCLEFRFVVYLSIKMKDGWFIIINTWKLV